MKDGVRVADPGRLYGLPEAGQVLGRSVTWLRQRIRKGELEAFSLPQLAIPGRSINEFLSRRRVSPVPQDHE